MLLSGSLPMSSAEIASTILSELRLVFSEFWILPWIPVTTMASRLLTASGLAGCLSLSFAVFAGFVDGVSLCEAVGDGVCSWAKTSLAQNRRRAVAHAMASGRGCKAGTARHGVMRRRFIDIPA